MSVKLEPVSVFFPALFDGMIVLSPGTGPRVHVRDFCDGNLDGPRQTNAEDGAGGGDAADQREVCHVSAM